MIKMRLVVLLICVHSISYATTPDYPTEAPQGFEDAEFKHDCQRDEPTKLRISIYSNKPNQHSSGDWIVWIWGRGTKDKVLRIFRFADNETSTADYIYAGGAWHNLKTIKEDDLKAITKTFNEGSTEEAYFINGCFMQFLNKKVFYFSPERSARVNSNIVPMTLIDVSLEKNFRSKDFHWIKF